MLTRRSMVIAGYYAAALFGSLAIWASLAIPVLRHARLVAQPSTAWLLTGAYAAAMAWAAWFLWRYWRRLDEAAKEAQKFAWFVGSIAAIVLTAPVMMFFRLGALPLLAGVPPGVDFGLGYMLLALSQLVGFLVAWAGWWQAKR